MEKDINNLRKDNFRIPDGYFDEVQMKISARLEQGNGRISPLEPGKGSSPGIVKIRKLVFIMGVAAACLAGFIIFKPQNVPAHEINLNGISNEDIATYLKENVMDIDLEMIANTDPTLTATSNNPDNLSDEEYDLLIDEISLDDIID
ncbi:MAG: hypothetical protein UZ08_BCD001002942 [Candidatus Parvibacillus calidus]|nr:MAG: hypothetical protein UZ08_BCD001002942 [Candidatus Parvibacillus calidus]WKZ63615.1 MAG: hypothetical protein QY315_02265 [Saprospiraceae bacterium]